ncbi:hypothetical protein ACLMAJ_37315 [Nocardia sp. KC 131]|uniref:hypothetical protein n=1 Tax=Nocardia arseniciresistens TaxID=3392119 RepID=UPI00398EFEE0
MNSKTPTSLRRRLARVAVAGALVTVPLATLAVTASAETPNPQEATDISRPHGDHDWPDGPGRDGPGHDGPRIRFHERGDHPGPDGPHQFFGILPPTGSS